VFADHLNPADWLLSTSPSMTPHLSRMLGIARDHCFELGYPRNDHLIRHERPPGPLVDDEIYEAIQSRGPVVGYFPTWRDDAMSIPGGDPVVSEMADIVGDQGGVLVFKSHHGSSSRVSSGGSLVVLPATTDLNAYLGICDVLVTDYSSVASDYLLLNRPIVLFAPDIDKYRGGRGFLFDPIEMQPGVLTRSKTELYALLSDVRGLPLPVNRDRLVDFYWDAAPSRERASAAELIIRMKQQGQLGRSD
jgi:CDP-glycerol glycerophosphotransferase